jgi:predicted ATPase
MYVPRPFASGRCEAGEGAAAGFPGPVSHLVGRKVEAARLRAAVLRVESGRGGTVLVEGDAGIGKTALLDLVAAYCRRAGMTLLRGGGSPLEQGLPFAALLSGLRGHHQEASPQITALLRGEGTHEAESRMASITEAVAQTLHRWTGGSPVVLLLDDIQWADSASLEVLNRLARHSDRPPLLVVAATRTAPTVCILLP